MMTAAQAVRDALHALLVKVRDGGRDAQQAGQYDATCDDILGATDRLFNSMGNAGEMVKQAKILAQVQDLPVFTNRRLLKLLCLKWGTYLLVAFS